jgi:FkbM family methyltransferase
LRTRTKIALARMVQRTVMAARRAAGLGPITSCRRGALQWKLDLREGVDFAIFLLGSFEPDLVRAYRRLVPPGATVIDIGANIGAHTLPLAQCVGPNGRVVAVEPTLYAFQRLAENLALNPGLGKNVTRLQVMLMSSKEAPLAEAIEASWPLQTPDAAHPEHLGVRKPTTGATVATLDEQVLRLGLERVDFLKLDVDGYEVEVLRGARETLSRLRPTIFFEHAPYVVAEKGYDPNEIAAILAAAGYGIADIGGRARTGGCRLPEIATGASINLIARPHGRQRDDDSKKRHRASG